MSHELSIRRNDRGLYIPVKEGKPVRVTDARTFAKEVAWHGLNKVVEGGVRIMTEREYDANAYTYIDTAIPMKDGVRYDDLNTIAEVEAFLADGGRLIYDLDTEIHPVYIEVGGRRIMTEYGMIVNSATRSTLVGEASNARWVPDPNVMAPVRTGITSEDGWLEYNPDGKPYTRSPRYEVVTPRHVFKMLDEVLYEETGLHMKAHSAGALGEDGDKGVWISVPLPKWHGDVMRLIDTDVESYMTLFNDPIGTMYVVETDIMTVCMNTWIMALSRATRRLKVDHQLGAKDRLREAMKGIWEQFTEGQKLIQEAVVHLANSKVTEEQAWLAAQQAYPLPGRPDPELVGVSSYDDRVEIFERNVERALASRDAFMQLYSNPRQARVELGAELGIPEHLEGTAFAVAQTATFLQTYAPSRSDDNVIRDWFKGGRLRATNGALNALMGGGQLQTDGFTSDKPDTVHVHGIGYPQALLDAHEDDTADDPYRSSVFKTSLN